MSWLTNFFKTEPKEEEAAATDEVSVASGGTMYTTGGGYGFSYDSNGAMYYGTGAAGASPMQVTGGYYTVGNNTVGATGPTGIMGATFNSNYTITTNGTTTTTFPYTYNAGAGIYIQGQTPHITTDQGKIDLNELHKMMETIRERLLIIVPNFEKHEKYEALKKAYDHYKLLEKMLGDADVSGESK